MESSDRIDLDRKKLSKPTERDRNFALIMLRSLQIGLTHDDAFFSDVGFLTDLFIEKSNDSYDYAVLGTTEDIDHLFGG